MEGSGRCQFCGSKTNGGVFECFDVFNAVAVSSVDITGISQFIYADAHALQHSEVHGTWNNNLHLTRQYLILVRNVKWNYSKTPPLSNVLDKYKLKRPEDMIPPLPVLARGRTTITDLVGLKQEEFSKMLLQWANDVYQSYVRYHSIAKVVGDLYINKFER
ncbi:DUF5946 family protein [Paenibacillus sp. GYB004]|uniref:DUF5946 family protein n=1 Tax=Paenibacillus sp. GYB004 TaxID=2994393 RepID=UPI002F96A909